MGGKPPLRYAWGDIVQVFTKECECGLPGHRIKILARIDDLLIVKGVNVYPVGIKDVVTSFSPKVTGEMQILLYEPPPRVVPPLKMVVEYGKEIQESQLDSLKKEIEEKISAKLKVKPEIKFVPPGTIKKDPTKKTKLLEKVYENK